MVELNKAIRALTDQASPTDTITLSKDQLAKLLTDSTKQGIELGKNLANSDESEASDCVPLEAPEFNPTKLFQQPGHVTKRFGMKVQQLQDEHGWCNSMKVFEATGWHDHRLFELNDHRNYYRDDPWKAIKLLVLSVFNATKQADIPVKERRDALSFADHLCSEWLEFAEEHMPTYEPIYSLNEKGGKGNADNS